MDDASNRRSKVFGESLRHRKILEHAAIFQLQIMILSKVNNAKKRMGRKCRATPVRRLDGAGPLVEARANEA